MPDFRIRDGRTADLAPLCEIEARSFAGDRLSRRSFRRLIASASARLRVAVSGGEVVGYHVVFTRARSAVARLYSIAVSAAARGHGLGERLLDDAERQAKRAGAAALRLEVRPDNDAARRLYVRRGFVPIGRRQAYYADGADALRFEKALGGASGRKAKAVDGEGESGEDGSPRGAASSPSVMKMSRSAVAGSPVAAARRSAGPSKRGLVHG